MSNKIIIFVHIMVLTLALFNYTPCYSNCNTCSQNDFTICVLSNTTCVNGYKYNSSSNTCEPLPAFLVITVII
jgi:hypothetical protein